jgi:hypothetical protein
LKETRYKKCDNPNVIAYIGPHVINHIDIKNPFVIAWWSAAFPGFGHLILGHYFIASILILHEIIINTMCGLNTAIYYSMIGEFHHAKQTLDTKWIIAYINPYVFAIWDSYQKTLNKNEEYIIAKQKGYEIVSNNFSAFCLNRLGTKNPIIASIWSFIAPGSGHIYIHRIPIAFLIPWVVYVTYFSNLLPAIHFLMVGEIEASTNLLNPQWLLYLPSLYGFMMYDSYLHTFEYNKLYKLQQKKQLEKAYQSPSFPIESLMCSEEKKG